jgi:hypothetical protein
MHTPTALATCQATIGQATVERTPTHRRGWDRPPRGTRCPTGAPAQAT